MIGRYNSQPNRVPRFVLDDEVRRSIGDFFRDYATNLAHLPVGTQLRALDEYCAVMVQRLNHDL